MAVDQHPVQRRIAGDAEREHRHHRTRMRQRGEQAAQHRKAEKSRRAPGDRPQKAADLGGERGIVARARSRRSKLVSAAMKGSANSTARASPAPAIRPAAARSPAPSACAASGATAERIPCSIDAAGEIEHRAEPRGGKRQGAEPPDHHRIGDAHRHLREIGRSERRRQRQGRAQLRANAGLCGTAKPLIGWIDRLHLALSHLRHGVPPSPRETLKKEGPRPVSAGPRMVACWSCSAHAHTLRPHGKAARIGSRHQAWECANHRRFVDEGQGRVNRSYSNNRNA